MVQVGSTSTNTAPRVRTHLLYNDSNVTRDIAPYLQGVTYTDNAGSQADEISLDLENIATLWGGKWRPAFGDQITATIVAFNWWRNVPAQSLKCGTFQLDCRTFDGPPDGIKLQALSAPLNSGLRRQRKHRSWEGMTEKDIAQDIADHAGLKLFFHSSINPRYERKDQHFQTDLSFLQGFCSKCGQRLKIDATQIIIFDEAVYEARPIVATIDRNTSEYTRYEFRTNFADVYRACTVNWHDSEAGAGSENYAVTFTPPNPPAVGETLEINERVENAAEAMILAKARLREKNRQAQTARFSLPLNLYLVGAATVNCINWSPEDDGLYMIDRATHTNGQSSSTTEVELHKALVGY